MDAEEEDVPTCPLCHEEFDATDRAVKACQCGFQVCVWCLHSIRERLNVRCPACRSLYEEHNFKIDDVILEQATKEAKDRQSAKKERDRREKLKEIERERARAMILSQQKAKSNLQHARILQSKLVYVIGLSPTLAREKVIRRADMFAKFGKMVRVLVNRGHLFNAGAPGGQSISAYVQYQRDSDALAAVRAMNNAVFDGRKIRCAIATTKYCDTYVRNVQRSDRSATIHCGNAICMYYHTTSHLESVLTREEVIARRLGPPPPAHLFLPAAGHRTDSSHHSAPPSQPHSTQPPLLAASSPSANRYQNISVPSSQPHSTAPAIHSFSGPTQPPNAFSATNSATVPCPGASGAALSSLPAETPTPPTPTDLPAVSSTTSHSQWLLPSPPHDISRQVQNMNRPSERGDRSSLNSPLVAQASSLPSASGTLSSATWPSPQPGHSISRSPTRRTPPPFVDEETRGRLSLGALFQHHAPPCFVDNRLQSLSENPGQRLGLGAPLSSHSASDYVPISSESAERSRTSSIMNRTAASAVPSSLSIGIPKHSTSIYSTSPPGTSIAPPPRHGLWPALEDENLDNSRQKIAVGWSQEASADKVFYTNGRRPVAPEAVVGGHLRGPPPRYGLGTALKADRLDDSRQKVATAWSQKASADKVFYANGRRLVLPVGVVGEHLPPRFNQATDSSRAGLENVIGSIGGSLGVSSEFRAVSQMQCPIHVLPSASASVGSVPPQYGVTAAQNEAHLRPKHNSASLTPASINRFATDGQSNAAVNDSGRTGYQQTCTVVDPLLGTPAHTSNYCFQATSTASAEVAIPLSLTGRHHCSRFSFAQDTVRVVDASNQPLMIDKAVHNYELSCRDVRPSDGSETLAVKKVSEFMADKNPSIASSRSARSRFDFANNGSSMPQTASD